MNFSEKLSKQRKSNNLSQEQLADAVGVTRQSVSKWESGESYPDMAKIIQLCKILNCSLNDIMDDGVMGEIKVEETKKVNPLEIFLKFITNLSNMFAHMSFSTIVKMIIEMVIVTGLVALFGLIVYSGLEFAIYEFFSIFSSVIARNIVKILTTLIELIVILICVIVVFHIFKIRYLDYYITIEDQNVTEQSEENPIEENKESNFTNNKREVVVIRDPKHSSSRFISFMGKLIKVTFKCFVVLCITPFIVGFLGATITAVFSLVQNGKVFKEAFVACLGAIAICASIIYYVYNFVFNNKQRHGLVVGGLLIGLLVTGIGVGLVANTIFKMEKSDINISETLNTRIIKDEVDLKENDLLILNCSDVEFVEDESVDNIKLEFTISENSVINTYEGSNSEGGLNYYYGSYLDDFEQMKLALQDLSNNTIRDNYNPGIIKVVLKGSSETISKFIIEDDIIRLSGQ